MKTFLHLQNDREFYATDNQCGGLKLCKEGIDVLFDEPNHAETIGIDIRNKNPKRRGFHKVYIDIDESKFSVKRRSFNFASRGAVRFFVALVRRYGTSVWAKVTQL